MAISGKENIVVGVENQATGSDSLYVAFNKTQNNFTTLFDEASPYTEFTAGNGINTVQSGNTVTITNTGVLNIVPGTGVTVLNTDGTVEISATSGGGGGVTFVGINSTTLDVSDSPIISDGYIGIELAPIPVSANFIAGEYIAPTLSVDEFGRINAIANTTSVGTVTSVAVAANGSGLAVTGSPITDNGLIEITNTGVTRLNAGSGIRLSGSTGDITITGVPITSGTVTRVDITSNNLTVLNAPITASGTITIDIPDDITLVGNLVAEKIQSNTTANITGNVNAGNLKTTGLLSVTGNANIGNIGTAGLIVATGNVTGGNLITAGLVSATGNITGGNLITGGLVSVTGNITGGNIKSNAAANIVGNLTAGNIISGGDANITGNITVGNLLANLDAVVTANLTANLLLANYFMIQGVSTGITANGNTLSNATPLTQHVNVVSTAVTDADGVQLPTTLAGLSVKVVNISANSVNVFPVANSSIDSLSANGAYVLTSNSRVTFEAVSSTKWYTFG